MANEGDINAARALMAERHPPGAELLLFCELPAQRSGRVLSVVYVHVVVSWILPNILDQIGVDTDATARRPVGWRAQWYYHGTRDANWRLMDVGCSRRSDV